MSWLFAILIAHGLPRQSRRLSGSCPSRSTSRTFFEVAPLRAAVNALFYGSRSNTTKDLNAVGKVPGVKFFNRSEGRPVQVESITMSWCSYDHYAEFPIMRSDRRIVAAFPRQAAIR